MSKIDLGRFNAAVLPYRMLTDIYPDPGVDLMMLENGDCMEAMTLTPCLCCPGGIHEHERAHVTPLILTFDPGDAPEWWIGQYRDMLRRLGYEASEGMDMGGYLLCDLTPIRAGV